MRKVWLYIWLVVSCIACVSLLYSCYSTLNILENETTRARLLEALIKVVGAFLCAAQGVKMSEKVHSGTRCKKLE